MSKFKVKVKFNNLNKTEDKVKKVEIANLMMNILKNLMKMDYLKKVHFILIILSYQTLYKILILIQNIISLTKKAKNTERMKKTKKMKKMKRKKTN